MGARKRGRKQRRHQSLMTCACCGRVVGYAYRGKLHRTELKPAMGCWDGRCNACIWADRSASGEGVI